jgi:hypothetical protein
MIVIETFICNYGQDYIGSRIPLSGKLEISQVNSL